MGPRASARGNKCRPRSASRHRQASMGPRASARGNGSETYKKLRRPPQLQWGRARPHAEIGWFYRKWNQVQTASMGPRASARGNRIRSVYSRWGTSRLQWGRARPHAEIAHGSKLAWYSLRELQWGRARPHAEMRLDQMQEQINSVLQWGRARPHAEMLEPSRMVSPRHLLQWGRARPHAEIGKKRVRGGAGEIRFNGAARVRTRKCLRIGVPPCWFDCFNGAARVRTRKSQPGLVLPIPAPAALQWGRARPHAEIRLPKSPPSLNTLLQWGRARPHAEIAPASKKAGREKGASMGPRASARGN